MNTIFVIEILLFFRSIHYRQNKTQVKMLILESVDEDLLPRMNLLLSPKSYRSSEDASIDAIIPEEVQKISVSEIALDSFE